MTADATAAATPMGTLIQKIHCQPMPWMIAPPSSGAVATPRPAPVCSSSGRV